MYGPNYIKDTVAILKSMAQYLVHIKKEYKIDNVILLQLVNEPWVTLDMRWVDEE